MCSWYLYPLLCDYNILALIVIYKVLQNIYLRSLPFTLKVCLVGEVSFKTFNPYS